MGVGVEEALSGDNGGRTVSQGESYSSVKALHLLMPRGIKSSKHRILILVMKNKILAVDIYMSEPTNSNLSYIGYPEEF